MDFADANKDGKVDPEEVHSMVGVVPISPCFGQAMDFLTFNGKDMGSGDFFDTPGVGWSGF